MQKVPIAWALWCCYSKQYTTYRETLMQCIFCKHANTDVVETRPSEDSSVIRRRRTCPKCEKRFTTYERTEQIPIIVIKRDGRRERFNRDKLRNSIIYPTEKTTVGLEQVETIVQKAHRNFHIVSEGFITKNSSRNICRKIHRT